MGMKEHCALPVKIFMYRMYNYFCRTANTVLLLHIACILAVCVCVFHVWWNVNVCINLFGQYSALFNTVLGIIQ